MKHTATQPITDRKTLEKVLNQFNNHNNEKVFVFSVIALNTGLRISDIINLTWDMINFNESKIILREQKTGKSKVIAINTRLAAVLTDYHKRTKDNVYILQSEKDNRTDNTAPRPVTRQYITKELNRIGKACNQQLSPHSLRKTFARTLYDNGQPLYIISEILNHSNERTTRIYLGITGQDLTNAYNSVSY